MGRTRASSDSQRRATPSRSIGLDIGSSAVRAAEVRLHGGGWHLARFGQVGLPPGAVVDGEVRDEETVSAAIRRLWSEAGFSGRHVVVGASGSRVLVRQAEAPDVPMGELRSSLEFRIQDLVPLPADNVEFDFGPLGPAVAGRESRTIMLAAIHGDVVRAQLAAVSAAGLSADQVDAVPLALLRAIGPSRAPNGTAEAVVSVGADLTVVAIRQDGVPAFIRVIARGGADVTRVLAESTTHQWALAEASKRLASDEWTDLVGRAATVAEVGRLVTEVRDTIDFFGSRPEGSKPITSVLVTGGGSRTPGLLDDLAAALSLPVTLVEPVRAADLEAAGIPPELTQLAGESALTALGLALWPQAAPYSRLNLLPRSVHRDRRARRHRNVAFVATAGVVVVLGALGAHRYLQVRHARAALAADNRAVHQLQAQAASFVQVTRLRGEVAAQRQVVAAALTGDVDWVRLLNEIGVRQPRGVTLTSFNGQASEVGQAAAAQPAPGAPTTGAAPATPTGTLSLGAKYNRTLVQVSQWVVAIEGIPGLENAWVSSIQQAAASTSAVTSTFSATASLGHVALSDRAQLLPGGKP
ncbi:MAG: type IV pilus assembly protein PilM [Acidimicrobiales bacterium]